jgi:outer membrane receptor protein involved in Fe transport
VQLFRRGSAVNSVDLGPVKADQVEVGYRGRVPAAELRDVSSLPTDDILSFRSSRHAEAVTPEFSHRGVELGLRVPLAARLRRDVWSYAVPLNWVVRSGSVNVDYSGNEMETAPRVLGNTRLAWTPARLDGGRLALEWMRLGSYWEDAANTQKYEGHDLLHLRASVRLRPELELFASVFNLTDAQFAETASYTVTRGEELAPGMPRTFYAGIQYRWRAPGQPAAVAVMRRTLLLSLAAGWLAPARPRTSRAPSQPRDLKGVWEKSLARPALAVDVAFDARGACGGRG